MKIDEYQLSEDFNRNQALYILHTIDGLSCEDLSSQFDLSSEEIEEILETHKKYELAFSENL